MTMLDRETELFQRALDEARLSNCPASADGGARFESRPVMRITIEFGPTRGGGGEARWGHALNWASEPEERPGSLTPIRGADVEGLREDDPEAIASELGIGAALTEHQLTRRWRAFVWQNHPDRRPPYARERATVRVAIANTLYDQARSRLAKGQ
jgi:hypothetical protein